MSKFYVYLHRDPETEEVVYVGKGCGGRAWDVTRNRGQHPEQIRWMRRLTDKGFIPSDWVEIVSRGLAEAEAFRIEKEYGHKHGVLRFNRQSGERQHQSKLSDAQAIEIFVRARGGEHHKLLAEEFGVSRSAVSMIASRKQWKAVTAGVSFENQ